MAERNEQVANARSQKNPHQEAAEALPYPDLKLDTSLFKEFFTDIGALAISPLHWGPEDWIKAGLVGGITTGLVFADSEIHDLFMDNPSPLRHDILEVGEVVGDGKFSGGFIVGSYLLGMGLDNEEMKATSLLAGESFLITSGVVTIMKMAFSRERPYLNQDPYHWSGPGLFGSQHHSFPSGHTATAFSLATVLADQYKRHFWVPPLAYGLATMTALSRMHEGEHWASDVFLGAALGYFTSKALYWMHTQPKGFTMGVRPQTSSAMTGLALDFHY